MIKHFCDICGRELARYHKEALIAWEVLYAQVGVNASAARRKETIHREVCGHCVGAIKQIIKELGTSDGRSLPKETIDD